VRIRLNGDEVDVPDGSTVDQLVAARAPGGRGVAVAVDGEVVPRSAWGARVLTADERVELLVAAQGG
jgi:sulfur carrier protein